MQERFYGLAAGIFFLLLGCFFFFFAKKIVAWQGKSQKGDWPIDVRMRKLKIGGILSILGGLYFILEYL